jgi:hypothetical protein
MSEVSYKRAKDALHTEAVRAYLLSTGVNPVLGSKPPDIHPTEETLPRVHRTTLAQLRSGKCSSLQTYQFFIASASDDICPACHTAPQSTNHLFACPSSDHIINY